MAEVGETRTFRARLRPSGWAWAAVLAGILVAVGVYQPGQALILFACAVGVCLIAWFRVGAVQLVISDSTVQIRERWFQPGREVARSDITAIHYFPSLISFRGPDNKTMTKLVPNWSLRQMLEVADELGVPLYDHRRWLGLRRGVDVGRLVNHPPPRKPVR
jgi:hypothetical protein